jgi:hypothetical protein
VTAQKYDQIPDIAERKSFILAEPLAVVISYVNSPLAGEGIHAIIDVGAGTTDVSFFRRSVLAGESVTSFYYCDSHIVGSDNIDFTIVSELRNLCPSTEIEKLVQSARSSKESYSEGDLTVQVNGDQATLDRSRLKEILNPVAERVFSGYQETWREAYGIEPAQTRWSHFSVFLVGGGVRLGLIKNACLKKPWQHIDKIENRDLPLPEDFVTLNSEDSEIIEEHHPMFLVAYGVSRHFAEWPEFYSPMDVDAMEIQHNPQPIPTWEENLNQD